MIENTGQSEERITVINEKANASIEPNQQEVRSSFREMMNDRNDYTEEAGTLIINSESPLTIILYTADAVNQSDNIKKEGMRKAVLYGVYRTFIHTPEPRITVTAHPTAKNVGGLTLEDEWTDAFGEVYWKSEGQVKLLDALRSAADQ